VVLRRRLRRNDADRDAIGVPGPIPPGQVTIAFPQDPDNAFSWVCIAPATGSFTDPTTNTTVTTVTANNGGATLIISPTSDYLTVDLSGNGATVVQGTNGGYIACCGGSGGTLPVLAYIGGSTLPI
jgi:hypothetical protein